MDYTWCIKQQHPHIRHRIERVLPLASHSQLPKAWEVQGGVKLRTKEQDGWHACCHKDTLVKKASLLGGHHNCLPTSPSSPQNCCCCAQASSLTYDAVFQLKAVQSWSPVGHCAGWPSAVHSAEPSGRPYRRPGNPPAQMTDMASSQTSQPCSQAEQRLHMPLAET